MRVTVSRGMHNAICRLYDDLWDQAPPEDSPAERAAAAVARALARQHDWPTPAALDDDLIDDPAYQPEGGWLPATLAVTGLAVTTAGQDHQAARERTPWVCQPASSGSSK